MTKILLVKSLSPEDPINSWDFRTWHLLNKGNADLAYVEPKKFGINQKPMKSKLPWNTRNKLKISSIGNIERLDIMPSKFLNRHKSQAKTLKKYVYEYLNQNHNCLILASNHDVGLLLADCFADKLIFESCDSASLYHYRRFQALNNNQMTKKLNSYIWSLVYQKIERYLSQKAKLYLVPSQADKDWILKLNPQANITAIGNGTPWVDEPVLNRINQSNQSPIIAFHGGMTWDPNRVTSIYLIKKILPLIRTKSPNIKLRIAGSPVFDELKKFETQPNVEICGFVNDIRGWLAECDVYVMPMLQGSGVKNKLIEAMAAGLTIVTNSLGAEALPEEAKQSIVIADGEENIANAVVHLLNNPQESLELGNKARQMAETYFRWETLSQQFMAEIEKIAQTINV